MRKKTLLLLLVLMALLLVGCGQETAKVGICLRQGDDGMTAQLTQSLTDAGYQVMTEDAREDQAVQLSQIQEMLREEYALLVVEPVMAELTEGIADLAKQADVPLILLGHAPSEQALYSWEKLCYIGVPEEEAGAMQAQAAAAFPDGGDLNLDGTLSYAVIAGPEDHMDTQSRTEGCIAAAGEGCLAVNYGDWTRESGEKNCRRLLAAWGKDLEMIFCNSDALAIGAMDALVDGGRTVGRDIYLVSIGGDRQARLLIRSGDLSAAVCPDLTIQTELITKAAQDLLAGKQTEKWQTVPYLLLTQENIEDHIKEQAYR